jgi:hypothetical protein
MSFDHWTEHESFIEQYGQFFSSILEEVLGLLTALERHTLSGHEARLKARTRFEQLMLEHVPSCRATVAAHQKKVAEQSAREASARADYFQRQQKLQLLHEQQQRELADAQDRARREAKQKEEREFIEARDRLAEAERQTQAERDRKAQEASAEAERLLAQFDTKGVLN